MAERSVAISNRRVNGTSRLIRSRRIAGVTRSTSGGVAQGVVEAQVIEGSGCRAAGTARAGAPAYLVSGFGRPARRSRLTRAFSS